MKKTNPAYIDTTTLQNTLLHKRSAIFIRLLLFTGSILAIWAIFRVYNNGNLLSNQPIIVLDPQSPMTTKNAPNDFLIVNDVNVAKVNWEVSQKIISRLNQSGIKAISTLKSFEETLSPEERANVALKNGAKILIRIDCSNNTNNGFAVYYPERLQEANAETKHKLLTQSENAAKVIYQTMKEGLKNLEEARLLQSENYLPSALEQRSSYFSRVPVVSIELGTITYLFDALFVSSDMGQSRLAETISEGILKAIHQESSQKQATNP